MGRQWGSLYGIGVMSYRILDMTSLILIYVLPLMLLFRGEGMSGKGFPTRHWAS